MQSNRILYLLLTASTILLASCEVKPRALKPGTDECYSCKMSIADARFAGQVLTKKGKSFVFDDARCVIGFLKDGEIAKDDIKDIFLTDYSGSHEWISIRKAHLFRSEELRSPMGGNIAAFENIDNLKSAMKTFGGERVIWDDLVK